jgi:hypothetical protein
MSSLKAGAMLSLFSGSSLEDAMRVAAKREASSFYYPAPQQAAAFPAVDLSAGSVRKQGAAAARLFDQVSQLMPNVLRSAFCGH